MEPSEEERLNTVRRSKWDKIIRPLIDKYASTVEVKPDSVFDDDQKLSIKAIFEIPFEGEFDFKRHFDMIWIQNIYQRL